MYPRHALGAAAEEAAYQYLCQHGLTLLTRNFRTRQGEIDLIMQDKQSIVFTEVRYRKSKDYGGAACSIDHKKQKKIIHVAKYYLVSIHKYDKIACRFDVVLVTDQSPTFKCDWLKDAFRPI